MIGLHLASHPLQTREELTAAAAGDGSGWQVRDEERADGGQPDRFLLRFCRLWDAARRPVPMEPPAHRKNSRPELLLFLSARPLAIDRACIYLPTGCLVPSSNELVYCTCTMKQ